MLQNRAIELAVGLFMLAGIAALAFLALRVSGLTLEVSEPTYRVYARFNNSSGLAPRARITMAGVVIGRVAGIRLDQKNFVAIVDMDIYKRFDNLAIDSSAAIVTSGLLGEKYIAITSGGDDLNLADGDEITDTQSALVLEDLIARFLVNRVAD